MHRILLYRTGAPTRTVSLSRVPHAGERIYIGSLAEEPTLRVESVVHLTEHWFSAIVEYSVDDWFTSFVREALAQERADRQKSVEAV